MRFLALAAVTVASCLGSAQTVEKVYNRDSLAPFTLKKVEVESTVVGPIVRTSTLLTYDNPYTSMTEACLNFGLPEAAALSGFAYYYGDEYVQGQLMDKAKAWFIYTAITSRGRDPGIMDQVTPTSYHCQIYPIKVGADLRIRLYSVAFLQPSGDKLQLPRPEVPVKASYGVSGGPLGKLDWTVRAVRSAPAEKDGDDYKVPLPTDPVRAIAQRFKDGRVYVAGLMHVAGEGQKSPTFAVLKQPKVVTLDPQTIAFMGWLPRHKKIAVRYNGQRVALKPEVINSGSETARLWAQQMLANGTWRRHRDVLRFSLKYGVPSTETALLAVPAAEMKLFHEKEKAWQRAEAKRRRQEREDARRGRGWSNDRNQNWNSGGGGDPEIRVTIPGANSVQAILPDRRVIELKAEGDTWGGNFEIAAQVPEGTYKVRILAHMTDGSTVTREWTYEVDRTPPTGTSKFITENGHLILEVRSEKGLAEVAAYAADGEKWALEEVLPGIYRVEVPAKAAINLKVVMKDRASNKGELACSLPR